MSTTTTSTDLRPVQADAEMEKDLESNQKTDSHLTNTVVQTFGWRDVRVVVNDRHSKKPKTIMFPSDGHVEAGQMLAIMAPSGGGKTTLLNVLAHRVAAANTAEVAGDVLVNGQTVGLARLREISSYVEQEDALIGSVTVHETMDFAARLSLPSSVSKKDRLARVDDLLRAFGLQGAAHALVGTPIRKGISGGQKRRLSVASQLITSPNILFLDEPTSGLDSVASFEVMNYIKDIARRHRLIVIASIHQPSTTTYELFDQLILLSEGKTCYAGPRADVAAYFAAIAAPIPHHTNPAEFLLDLVNVDFTRHGADMRQQLDAVHQSWSQSAQCARLKAAVAGSPHPGPAAEAGHRAADTRRQMLVPFILLHRNFIKSYRDIIAYGIRVVMYLGLAILVGTVWLRLPYNQSAIQPFINGIFFGGAFMSFMAVAYVPAIIEDLHMFRKERANGLYGPLPFTIANFLIGIPYLFLIALLFSIVAYWLSNYRPHVVPFWTWVMWLFLDLLAAEGLVVLVTSIVPIFVVSLAITAFANGLWMCVGGFFVPLGTLNVFWKCT